MKTTNASSPLVVAYNKGSDLLDDISKVPDGTIGGSMTAFGYRHFDGTGAVNDVPSTFPGILGTANTGSPSGAVKDSWNIVKGINDGLRAISDNAGNFSGQIGTV